jgi:branched-chain amino acid transport system substrate-binding protein
MSAAYCRRTLLPLASAAIVFALAAVPARAADPIRIGVIAEAASVAGAAIPNAANLAAAEINAAGGVNGRSIEIVAYDNKSSAADSVRAFQRAVQQDHVSAVIASYISEVVLALEPWAGRLKTPMITPGAASDLITHRVHDDYDHLKYVFHGYLASTQISDAVCDAARDLLLPLKVKTVVVMSEDAAWTIPLDDEYLKCLPKIGVTVIDHIRLSPDTTDFTPVFNKIEDEKPDVIVTGISHIGVQPTVQWAEQHVPIPMFGVSSQATTSTFWKDTNGAANGVVFNMFSAPDVAVTPKTIPFAEAYQKKYGVTPSYAGYTAYDDVYILAEAFKKADGTDPDKVVAAMEQTDWVGTIGRIQYLGRDSPFTHGMKIGAGFISGLMVEWKDGKQVTVWPKDVAVGAMTFPSFIRLAQ